MLSSPYKKPSVLPPPAHPRLMLKRSDVLRVKRNMSLPENSAIYEKYQFLCRRDILCEGATPEYGTYDMLDYLALEAKALKALLSGSVSDAETAVSGLMLLLDGTVFISGNMKARWGGHLIFTAAEVYDWCYDTLTAAQKDLIIGKCEDIAGQYFEMGYPPSKQSAISGHGGEAQLLRDLLAFSIAVYDERPDIYDFCAGRILDEYVPAYDFLFAGGFHPQGPAYGAYRYTCLLWSAMLFYSMSGERVFTGKLDELAESFVYLLRPDGEAMRLGDDFNETKAPYTRGEPFAVPMFFAAAYTGNEKYYEIFRRGLCGEYLVPSHHGMDYYDGGAYGEGLFSPAVFFIWNGLTTKKAAPLRKPYKYFGHPAGITVWNDGERVVLMKIGELWGANHDHLDTGCFQIYCHGILASDSGVYDSYGSPHRKYYTIRTGAHNCLTVSDPEKPRYGEWNEAPPYDGGTRRPCGGKEPATLELWRNNYRMATVLSHSESEDSCRITGDLSAAYTHTCEQVVRDMLWEPKRGSNGTLTVRDTVVARSEAYTAAFHIHCQSRPEIKNSAAVIDNGAARLICRILSPADAIITLAGGAGHEFEIDSRNIPTDCRDDTEAGWGQIIVTSGKRTKQTDFVIQMEIEQYK